MRQKQAVSMDRVRFGFEEVCERNGRERIDIEEILAVRVRPESNNSSMPFYHGPTSIGQGSALPDAGLKAERPA
jgi:hypothetical protein